MLIQCGGHPFLAQYIMHYAWDSLQKGTAPVLSTIVNKFRADRINDLEQWCVDIGEAGMAAYKILSEAGDWLTQPEIEQVIPDRQLLPKVGLALYKLCYHGLVQNDGSWEHYRVTGRLFQNWFADEKLPYLTSPTSPRSTRVPRTSFLDCKPNIKLEIAPVYPTAYWHLMKKDRFPLITLIIDNTCLCCTNARFHNQGYHSRLQLHRQRYFRCSIRFNRAKAFAAEIAPRGGVVEFDDGRYSFL